MFHKLEPMYVDGVSIPPVWRQRAQEYLLRVRARRTCERCGAKYGHDFKHSWAQFLEKRFCGPRCASAHVGKEGLEKARAERRRRITEAEVRKENMKLAHDWSSPRDIKPSGLDWYDECEHGTLVTDLRPIGNINAC